jgi:hypothetical protein
MFTGQNAFAGANVLAIVVDIDAPSALAPVRDAGSDSATSPPADAGLPTLAVSAETIRRSR